MIAGVHVPRYRFCPMCSATLTERREADGACRQACEECGWVFYPHMAISVSAVVTAHNQVLLVRRRHEPHSGTWMFPSGFLEYGEVPEVGVLRELKEETSLDGSNPELISMMRSEDDPREPGHLTIFYKIGQVDGVVSNEPNENLAVSWFSLRKLPEIALRNHILVANHFKSELAA